MEKKDPCPKVRARQAQDKRHGNTTSQATIDFIRRTCDCQSCRLFRTCGSTTVKGVAL